MQHLSLFSGAGGGEYAARLLGWSTVAYVEQNEYCQRVIKQRQADGVFCDGPVFGDIIEFDGGPWRGRVDIISGGFPCQPFSLAGRRKSSGDSRNMWPEAARVIGEVEPALVFLENVPGLVSSKDATGGRYFGTILGNLCELGFDAEWSTLSAQAIGAPHRRNRLWILAAHPGRFQLWQQQGRSSGTCWEGEAIAGDDGLTEPMANPHEVRRHGRPDKGTNKTRWSKPSRCSGAVAYADSKRQPQQGELWPKERRRPSRRREQGAGEPLEDSNGSQRKGIRIASGVQQEVADTCRASWWTSEPSVRRVAHGVANRRQRLTALGNGQVPLVAACAFLGLLERMLTAWGL